ncbi:MAG: hypothetical protein EBV83_07035 [Verrucomicrobia bacterium]|nr:hypothetical protein [Verrucomicrobiota bacterium]
MKPSEYRSYRDLPPLAGVGTLAEGMRLGPGIDECVQKLKRHHWAFRHLHEIFIKRLTAEPAYELKMGFSLHAYYCAEHAAAWRKRVAEMREPPLGLDVVPHEALEAFFDEILNAPDIESLLLGVYEHALPSLQAALKNHFETTNVLVDHPSRRICRFALIEVEEMLAFGQRAISAMVDAPSRTRFAPQKTALDRLLSQAGGLDGTGQPAAGPIQRHNPPRPYDSTPRRDERFPDPYNMGVHAEKFLYEPSMPDDAKTLMMFYKRLREIDVPEMMASIIAETKDKPWAYTVDMTRQLWDEARHAMMGEVGFVRAGIDWQKFVRINFTWSLALNSQLTPRERHAVLYFIEQGLMPKTGKRYEWEVGKASGDPFAALIQDFDWADEVLHARIGRDWYVKEMGDPRRAVDYGDECWSRVLIDWQSYVEKGLTAHRNWWPDLYREWCLVHRKTPRQDVLAFSENYSGSRADLAELNPVSG